MYDEEDWFIEYKNLFKGAILRLNVDINHISILIDKIII